MSILKEGGNAIEAMIASAAMISVVYPHMNSMGGMTSGFGFATSSLCQGHFMPAHPVNSKKKMKK